MELLERLLKRTPAPASLTYSAERLYPIKRRGAVCNADVAAAALIQSGLVYMPPPSGGIIRACAGGSIAATMNPWTWALVTNDDWQNAGGGFFGNSRQTPLWADAPLRGFFSGATVFGLGNFFSQMMQGSTARLDLEVNPPNVFLMINGTTNSQFSGVCLIEEPVSGDESL